MLTPILMFYLIINIPIWIGLVVCGMDALDYSGIDDAFMYPWIWKSLDNHDINLAGKLIVCFLFTILTLPAYLLWLLTLGLVLIGYGIVKLFCKVFKKKK